MSPEVDDLLGPTQRLSTKDIRFFNVTLKNGIVMSTPSYQEKQSFCASLISSIEMARPVFAWIQFLFLRIDQCPALLRMKNSLLSAKKAIERPSLDLISGEAQARRELQRDYYRQAERRMKKIDDILTKPMVSLAIQGMWVSREGSGSISSLPFDHCVDEHDSLAVFEYHDPRMLIELAERRMVEEIPQYLGRFTGSRVEPPTFIVTPEELASYVHLPAGERLRSVTSLSWGTLAREFTRGKVAEDDTQNKATTEPSISTLVRLAQVPKIEDVLEESAVQPLIHLASATIRTFEVTHRGSKTEILLSAKSESDMRRYIGLFNSIYGEMKYETVDRIPDFLNQLPQIVGLRSSVRHLR